MSDRDGYAAGVPCWVDTWQADPERAAAFYGALFGWEVAGDAEGDGLRHVMLHLRDRAVAGVGTPAPEGQLVTWTTYVQVDDIDGSVDRVVDTGGHVVTPPFDSLDGGRMALVADPAGAVLAIWQLGEFSGAEVVNEPGAWSMSALSTGDAESAAAFYHDVFGWETESFGPATLFRLPGFVGGEATQPVPRDVVAVMMPAADATPAAWNVDFWVADAHDAAATARAHGGTVVAGPSEDPMFRRVVLADPAGAVFSVSQLLAIPS